MPKNICRHTIHAGLSFCLLTHNKGVYYRHTLQADTKCMHSAHMSQAQGTNKFTEVQGRVQRIIQGAGTEVGRNVY